MPSAPADWTWLLEPAWARPAGHVPAGYELVVRPMGPVVPPRVGGAPRRLSGSSTR